MKNHQKVFDYGLIRLSLLITSFGLALVWLLFLVRMAPITTTDNEKLSSSEEKESGWLKFPSNLSDLKRLAKLLDRYEESHPGYVLVLFCSAYLFKQTFAIPGSVFMNLLGGAIYGTWKAFPLCCLLTATGATFCYGLSNLAGRFFVEKYFMIYLQRLREKLRPALSFQEDDGDERSQKNLLWLLISLRLFPITPNWFLNIASPMVNIPVGMFFLSVLLGLIPYNLICVQTGSILSTLNSLDDVFSLKTFSTMLVLAIVFVVIWFVKKETYHNQHPPQKTQ